MHKQQLCFLSVAGLLFAVMPTLAAGRRVPDPCRQQQDTFEQQIRDFKTNQSNELKQCQAAHGKDSYICKDLKANQKRRLKLEKASDQAQLRDCRSPVRQLAHQGTQSNNENYYDNNYNNNRDHHYRHDPDHDGTTTVIMVKAILTMM